MVCFPVISFLRARAETIAYILSGIILGGVILYSPYAALFLAPALIILLLISKSPLKALSILIFLIPFSGTSIFKVRLAQMPGTEPLYILAYVVLAVAIINYKQSSKITKFALFFTTLFLTIFTLSILHSLVTNIDFINFRRMAGGKTPYSNLAYLLQYFVRQLIYFIPFIIIIKFAEKLDNIEFIIKTLFFAIMALSVWILYLNLFKIEVDGVGEATEAIGSNIGLYRNALADFLMVGFPIVLSRYFLKKNIINVVNICLIFVAIGFLYSRTAYVVLILSFILYLIISKRFKFMPVIIVIAVGVSFILPSSIMERASHGLESNDMTKISAGRTGNTWLPLIEELAQDPKKLLFGGGRYAIVSSNAVAMGVTSDTIMHPHNMYLEQILDGGILGFMAMMSLFIVLFKKAFKSLKNTQDYRVKEYLYAVIVSMISFFIAGITGRSLFPVLKNSYFWITVGIALVLIRLVQKSEENGSADIDRIPKASLGEREKSLLTHNPHGF